MWFWIGALFVAALFSGAAVLAVCLAVDHYESGGRAKRDLLDDQRP